MQRSRHGTAAKPQLLRRGVIVNAPRAQMTGEAYTFVSPEEKQDFSKIERAVGSGIERATLDGFAYEATAEAPLEASRAERPRTHRKKRAQHRGRPAAKKAGTSSSAENGDGSAKSGRPRRRRYGRRRD